MDPLHGHPGQRGTSSDLQPESWAIFGIANGGLRVGHGSGTSGDLLRYYAEDGVQSRSHSERQGPHAHDPAMRELLHAVVPQPDAAQAHGRPGGSEASPRLSGPIQFILKLLEFWHLRQDDAVLLLGFDQADASHVIKILEGTELFRGRDVRDRIAHLFHIRISLSALFRDLDVENDWLRESHSLLNGESPMALLLGGSMEALLLVREYVDAAAGR